jgi:DNA mismatch repair protein MutL
VGTPVDRIQILPDSLVSQIAAGEVIERPASVVKELVENSLDAGATRIDIDVAEGGVRSISVRDNGCGMSERDATLAFCRHATSKIRALADLSKVTTLGFRGEALPSIASVARVRLRTRRPDDPLGVEILAGSDDALRASAISCAPGTAVEVAELFHSVPARRKFLKSTFTESLHIARWVEEIGLVRCDVRFALERSGQPWLTLLPTRELRERVISVLPARLGEQLEPFEVQDGTVEVRGFASPTNVMRGSTSDVHLFVNDRAVRDRVLLSAVREAYRDALPVGRHPVLVLYVRVPPEEVDANVHPTKSEVRFRDPRGVHRSVREAIARAVGVRRGASRGAATLAAGAPEGGLHGGWLLHQGGRLADALPEPPASQKTEQRDPQDTASMAEDAERSTDLPRSEPRWMVSSAPVGLREHRFVGQLFGTYLAFERRGSLVLIDQHAAHERILFEQLRRGALSGKLRVPDQTLLAPLWLELGASSSAALEANQPVLAAAGFELEWVSTSVRGGARIAVRSIPALLRHRPGRAPVDLAAALEETAAGLADPPHERGQRDGIEAALHHVLATAACHAAIRRGDRVLPQEVAALLEGLEEQIQFANCPHGRPIAWTLEEREIARHFLRPLA